MNSKQIKYLFPFFIFLIFCFYALAVFAADSNQFPDASRLQPIPPGVRPRNPGNINKSAIILQNNSLALEQISGREFDLSSLDGNSSYIDAIDHRLFVADTENNRVFVFDLDADNVLIDNIPDNVLGQPDFTTSDPGTTQSKLDSPAGLAYDADSGKLFVADTNNNRIMIFDIGSISNGENAVSVLGQNQDWETSPRVAARMQSEPAAAIAFPAKKNISWGGIMAWLFAFLAAAVSAAAFYFAKIKKENFKN